MVGMFLRHCGEITLVEVVAVVTKEGIFTTTSRRTTYLFESDAEPED